MNLTESDIKRYARHLLLPSVGSRGQEKLLSARVLVVGAGGLGSPLILYLAAAGVGHIGICDDDRVDVTNLQRQIAHSTAAIGRPKVDSAAEAALAINPSIEIIRHPVRIDADNALGLVSGYDIVADGSDNFATRFLVNDACRLAGKTLVSAALFRFHGQLATFKAPGPCYRCLHPDDSVPSCAEAGVLGPVAGLMGTLQAGEVVKEILSIGDSMAGSLLLVDALSTDFHKIRVKPDPDCPLCGPHATIHAVEPIEAASCQTIR